MIRSPCFPISSEVSMLYLISLDGPCLPATAHCPWSSQIHGLSSLCRRCCLAADVQSQILTPVFYPLRFIIPNKCSFLLVFLSCAILVNSPPTIQSPSSRHGCHDSLFIMPGTCPAEAVSLSRAPTPLLLSHTHTPPTPPPHIISDSFSREYFSGLSLLSHCHCPCQAPGSQELPHRSSVSGFSGGPPARCPGCSG